MDPEVEKFIFIGYSLEQKGYKCYNPATRQLRVSKNVVSNEMSNWYSAKKVARTDLDENVVAEIVQQESQTLSGRGESSCSKSKDKPWSGKLHVQVTMDVSQKGKEKVFEPFDIFVGHSTMDGGDSSGSEMSLDEEFGIPGMKTLGVKKAMKSMNENLSRSTRVKNLVQRLNYSGFVARHYACTAKVVQDVDPTCFDEAVGNVNWEKAMDGEMAAFLYGNET